MHKLHPLHFRLCTSVLVNFKEPVCQFVKLENDFLCVCAEYVVKEVQCPARERQRKSVCVCVCVCACMLACMCVFKSDS